MWNRDQVGEIRNLGFEVSGLEPALEMRRLANAANPGVDIRDGSITALPYDDGTFNVVLAPEVLRYLPAVDNETAWREMLRVLRPGRHDHRHHGQPVADRRYWLYERLQARRASRGSIAVRAHCEFVTPGQVRGGSGPVGCGFGGHPWPAATSAPVGLQSQSVVGSGRCQDPESG